MVPFTFPVGFQRFSSAAFVNYQMNRLYACGLVDAASLKTLCASNPSIVELPAALGALSAEAEARGDLRLAFGAQRGAEFFTPPGTPARVAAWTRMRALFDRAFGALGYTRHEVPYGGASMPVTVLPAQGPSRGRVLLMGGFDSVIEEFVGVWIRLSEAGFDVAAMEGPGQGGARIAGLTFDHDYERPVAAILDQLGWDDVTIIGLSMGGYWALRAAGREPRVTRAVAWPPVYDWLAKLPGFAQRFVRWMVSFRGFMRWSVRLRAKLIPVLGHAVTHTMYLVDGDDPMLAVDWLMGMNKEHLGSERVTQDVLLMVGEQDDFQPPVLAERQAAALTHARSVTTRRFTAAEHAAAHCQMGNLQLACEVLISWLSSERPHPQREP